MLSALHVGMFIGTWNVFMYNLLAFFSPSPPSPHFLSFIHPTRQSKVSVGGAYAAVTSLQLKGLLPSFCYLTLQLP